MTDTPPRSVKRYRSYSSPLSADECLGLDCVGNMAGEKVGELTQEQLMASLSILLDNKLAHLATKDDVSQLSGRVAELSAENQALKEKVKCLKSSEKLILEKLLDLEGRSRRNNLIFKGLKWVGRNPDFREVVRRFCNEVLGADDRVFVNRAHPLGKDRSAIIAHMPNDCDVEYIMSQVRRLKGSDYVVHRDLPREVREKRARLMAVRAEIERVAGKKKMPMVYDHLFVDGRRLTWEDGQLRAGQDDGAETLHAMFDHDFSRFLADPKLSSIRGQQLQPQRYPEGEQPSQGGPSAYARVTAAAPIQDTGSRPV